MNIGTIKLLCWLSSMGMATALVLGVGNFMTNLEEHSRPVSAEYVEQLLNEDLRPQIEVREVLRYPDQLRPAFIEMNWTGKPKPKPVHVEEGPEMIAPLTETPMAEVLNVLSVFTRTTDPGGSLAYAMLKAGERDELYLRVGDRLPRPNDHVLVHAIRPGGVEFAFTDGRENEVVTTRALGEDELITRVGEGGVLMPSRDGFPRGREGGAAASPQTERLAPDHYLLGDDDLAEFGQDYARILTEDVRTRTYFDADGNRAGVEIQSVKEGSIAARHGANAGDVVISINGHKVSSEQEAIQFVKSNSDKYKVWEVQVLRLGRIETIVYNSPE